MLYGDIIPDNGESHGKQIENHMETRMCSVSERLGGVWELGGLWSKGLGF